MAHPEGLDDRRRDRRLRLDLGDVLATRVLAARAPAARALEVHFQPIFDLPVEPGTAPFDQVGGVEALVRWNHPEFGLLSPGRFLPLVAESAAMVEIGRHVLDSACQAVAGRATRLAVNVADRELVDPGFVGGVVAAIDRSGVDPARLTLEIAEDAVIARGGRLSADLEPLTRLGVTVAVDGAGARWLTERGDHPDPAITAVKLDRRLIGRMVADRGVRAVVGALVDAERAAGRTVVANGVENNEQLALATDLGCSQAQGFLLGRPVEAARCWPDEEPARSTAGPHR
jgi:EAL domain-containing protein (putative c-di-GMP-specific phosphodiesterase class I)